MLSRLHRHVEHENSRWLSYAEDLQRQLDKALNTLIARNLQRNRQKSQDNSENENKDSGDKSEVELVTAK